MHQALKHISMVTNYMYIVHVTNLITNASLAVYTRDDNGFNQLKILNMEF